MQSIYALKYIASRSWHKLNQKTIPSIKRIYQFNNKRLFEGYTHKKYNSSNANSLNQFSNQIIQQNVEKGVELSAQPTNVLTPEPYWMPFVRQYKRMQSERSRGLLDSLRYCSPTNFMRFQLIQDLMRVQPTPATFAISCLCVGIYTFSWIDSSSVIRLAATPSHFWQGELWRGITSTFIHVNLLHLAMNMGVWITAARTLELQFDWKLLLLVVLMTGFVGTVCEATFNTRKDQLQVDVPIIGISGAVCGLLGFGLVASPYFPVSLNQSMLARLHTKQLIRVMFSRGGIATQVMVSVGIFGFFVKEYLHIPIANIAHFAGFMSGAILGVVPRAKQVPRFVRAAIPLSLIGFTSALAVAPVAKESFLAWKGVESLVNQDFESASLFFEFMVKFKYGGEWAKVLHALCLAQLPNSTDKAREILSTIDTTRLETKDQLLAVNQRYNIAHLKQRILGAERDLKTLRNKYERQRFEWQKKVAEHPEKAEEYKYLDDRARKELEQKEHLLQELRLLENTATVAVLRSALNQPWGFIDGKKVLQVLSYYQQNIDQKDRDPHKENEVLTELVQIKKEMPTVGVKEKKGKDFWKFQKPPHK